MVLTSELFVFAETCVSYKFKCLNSVESNKQILGRYFIH